MGEAIKSRGSGAEPYRVGDIVLTSNETLGEKWALCNGDPVTGGIAPELEESLHANPLDNNSWQDVTFTNKYDKLLYDSENNVYYGIITSSKGTGNDIGFDLSIYKIDPDMKQETLLVDTGYLSYNYVSYFIDAVYSNYEKKIILLIHTTYTVEGEDNNTYFYLVRYDPLSSDTSSLTNHNYWTKQYISGSTVYDEWYDYENEEFISTSTDMYYPDRMFVTDDGYVVFLCHSPRYAIFIYSIDNMIHRDDFYFTYEIGDWEDYYGEYVRDTTITTEVNISVAESKNYIAIGIGYRDDYEPMSLADSGYVPTISSGSCAFIFDKTNNSLTTLSNMYSDWDETENVPTPNMSCIDFENNKFLLSTVQFSSTSKVYEIVANTAVDYNTRNNRISLNAF